MTRKPIGSVLDDTFSKAQKGKNEQVEYHMNAYLLGQGIDNKEFVSQGQTANKHFY